MNSTADVLWLLFYILYSTVVGTIVELRWVIFAVVVAILAINAVGRYKAAADGKNASHKPPEESIETEGEKR